ncbi:MAG: DUF58 domain-containing protein [Legionella sp.]|nr:DUF58 domain-containing protein [Legionella sp.]
MTEGVTVELSELIDLRRFVQSARFKPQKHAKRSGQYLSRLRGRGMDFAEVRNYQPGDEIRHMEWRITARTGKPHVKLYEEEREQPVLLVVDFNPSMIFGTQIAFKSVVAARLAALILWNALHQNDRIGGFFFSTDEHNEYIPRGRDASVLPMLLALSNYTKMPSGSYTKLGRPLSNALERVRRVSKPGSLIAIISDFYNLDAESAQQLQRLRQHNDLLAYQICDPLELSSPPPGQYAITDGHRQTLLDMYRPGTADAYNDYCQQRLDEVQKLCRQVAIPYMKLTAADNLPQVVRQTFLRKGAGRYRGAT